MRSRLSLPLILALLACSPAEVVVFDDVAGGQGGSAAGASGAAGSAGTAGSGADGGSSGSGGGGGTGGDVGGCSENSDCPSSWTCQKLDCFASRGVCEPRPVLCSPDPSPVCGCDFVTYWNDCVRRQSGVTPGYPGECRSGALRCNSALDCGVANASCSRLVPPGEPCDPDAEGICWVTSPGCPPSSDPLRWVECRPPSPDLPPPPCVDTCEAIVSEKPHVPPYRGMCP